jgi:2Fe-2S ferredoxin
VNGTYLIYLFSQFFILPFTHSAIHQLNTDIRIYVEEAPGQRRELEAPTDMGLSLMELLKANDYPIQATCGGMALCATCHVEVLAGPPLPEPSDDEWAMLDTLPVLHETSRLSCQIRLAQTLDGLVVRIADPAV